MPILNCTVITCIHNAERQCELNSIKVEGKEADVSDSTACGSFRERTEDTFANGCGCNPKGKAKIDCEAVHCTYNDDCKCRAGEIEVAGTSASRYDETRCSTFTED